MLSIAHRLGCPGVLAKDVPNSGECLWTSCSPSCTSIWGTRNALSTSMEPDWQVLVRSILVVVFCCEEKEHSPNFEGSLQGAQKTGDSRWLIECPQVQANEDEPGKNTVLELSPTLECTAGLQNRPKHAGFPVDSVCQPEKGTAKSPQAHVT